MKGRGKGYCVGFGSGNFALFSLDLSLCFFSFDEHTTLLCFFRVDTRRPLDFYPCFLLLGGLPSRRPFRSDETRKTISPLIQRGRSRLQNHARFPHQTPSFSSSDDRSFLPIPRCFPTITPLLQPTHPTFTPSSNMSVAKTFYELSAPFKGKVVPFSEFKGKVRSTFPRRSFSFDPSILTPNPS